MRVRITGSRVGLRKIDLTKEFRSINRSLSLTQGKRLTDDVLDGKIVTIEVDDNDVPDVCRRLVDIGAIVETGPQPHASEQVRASGSGMSGGTSE
jgi:hypothetical protein